MMTTNDLVWIPDCEIARLTCGLFRRVIVLSALPVSAELNLSARMHYQLHINGAFIGCGPARAYPEFLEYDTYDIARHLKLGENVLAVEVLHYGAPNFHYPDMPPGFLAWGAVRLDNATEVDLASATGWKCRLAEEFDRNAPSFSFAIGPVQIEDQRLACQGWRRPGFTDALWGAPVMAEKFPASPAVLRPRQIPPLTNIETEAGVLLDAFTHLEEEEILSFRICQKISSAQISWPAETSFACTFIHSPCAQEIVCGAWWGEHYLNGKPLEKAQDGEKRPLRDNLLLPLRKGWNTFFVSYGMVQGIWEFHLALPRDAGLGISCDKTQGKTGDFLTAGPLPNAEAATIIACQPWIDPVSCEHLREKWQRTPASDNPVSPQRALCWLRRGATIPCFAATAREITVPANIAGSLIYDFENIVLGRIFVEYTAPRGTVLTFGYAEEESGLRPHYAKNFLVNAAERRICAGGRSRMETFNARGLRYLELAVSRHDTDVVFHRVGVVEQRYPLEKRGSFRCSDEFYNTLWEYGWRTLQLCCEDVLTDCPWRERALYGGDMLAEMATLAVASGDLRLVRRCAEIFLQSWNPETGMMQSMAPMERERTPLYEYPVLVFMACEWYCRLSGDLDFAVRARPVFSGMFAGLMRTRNKQGLFPARHPLFIEHGYPERTGVVCTFNALMVGALHAWARMQSTLGLTAEAAESRDHAQKLERLVDGAFWNMRKNAYADSIRADKPTDSCGIAAGAWMMLFSAVTEQRASHQVSRMRQAIRYFDPQHEEDTVSSYGAFYLLGALYKHGCETEAEAWMKTIYADMLRHSTGPLWEHANPLKSLTHAWSTAPNFYLSTRVLGVRLGFPEVEPETVVIAPQSGSITWAEGTVPHPAGEIYVKWQVNGQTLDLKYRCPPQITPVISPLGRLGRLHLQVQKMP